MDIADFLLARVAEDESVARAVHERSPWSAATDQWAPMLVDADGWDCWDNEGSSRLAPSGSALVHIARHDPVRVLAECAAKREIIKHFIRGYTDDLYGPELARILAFPYADHPDYMQAWRPTETPPEKIH